MASKHYWHREAEVNRFTTLGVVTLVIISIGFWGIRTYALQGLRDDGLEAPWVVETRRKQGTSEPGATGPVASELTAETRQAVEDWKRQISREAETSTPQP